MDYPQRFFQQVFSEARGLELARRFAIYASLLSFLIISVAATIVWAHRSQSAKPYFLYINPETGVWSAYGQKLQRVDADAPWYKLIQESLAVRITENWLRIPENPADADTMWCGGCQPSVCGDGLGRCKLCCLMGAQMQDYFKTTIMPEWRRRLNDGETLRATNIVAEPFGGIDEAGGLWRVTGVVVSNKTRAKNFVVFVRIGRNQMSHADKLGFFVSEFNFFIMEQGQ